LFDNRELLQQFAQRFSQTPAIPAKMFIGIDEFENLPYPHNGHQMCRLFIKNANLIHRRNLVT